MTIVILSVLGLLSVVCEVLLWRTPGKIIKKFLWTIVVAIPFLGPVCYGAFYEVPKVRPKHEQCRKENLSGGSLLK